MSATGENREIV